MRYVVVVAVGAVLLGLPGLAAGATGDTTPFTPRSHAALLGLVPPHVDGHRVGTAVSPRPWLLAAATASPFDNGTGPNVDDNVTYGGTDQTPAGHVMSQLTAYAIYWVPKGYKTATNYQSVVDGFFTNAAADSGGSNVFSTTMQYGNPTTGAFTYGMTFGGSVVDTWPYPASGCTEPPDVLGLKVCLADLQVEAEVKRVADARGWPHGHNVEFFMFTPANVGSCYDPANSFCAYDVYCAYHSEFVDRNSNEYIYANLPWPNQKVDFGFVYPSDCDGGQHPNGSGSWPTETSPTPLDAADEVLDSVSHEASESITDPDGYEWWDDSTNSLWWGAEVGDLCSWYYPDSAILGSTPFGQFTQLLGNGQYYIQGEWSNASATSDGYSGCVWSYPAAVAPANNVRPAAPTGPTTYGSALVAADTGTWSGNPRYFSYQWDRCNAAGGNCSDIDGATGAAYTVGKADVGHTLAVVVNAASNGGHASALSAATALVTAAFPYNTAVPTITPIDTVTVGHRLTGSAGTWGGSPTSYTFLWQRCDDSLNCVTVKTIKTTQATVSYTIVPADDKHTIVLGVIAASPLGSTGIAVSSAPSASVGGEPEGGSVQITGTLATGQLLQATTSGWSPAAASYKTVWQRCDSLGNYCATIKSVTGRAATTSYTLRRVDLGHTIYVQVWATNTAGTGDVASDITDTVAS